MQKISIETMSPYIWRHMCKDIDSGEWGHFIDINTAILKSCAKQIVEDRSPIQFFTKTRYTNHAIVI